MGWHCYQELRLVYHVRHHDGKHTLQKLLDKYTSSPIPEIKRLIGTLTRWKTEISAYFDTAGASNGPTEAINGVIETTTRIARGFRNFINYRIRSLLAAGGYRPYRN
ncbi:ISL3 family transposase [Pseudarthrobacter sp. H2]|uniref:ISL3 family transposase n=1 Tax=Pseudarthrobacter sp. H2 TaxID=3418415 RepID=UPI003CF35ED5